MSPEEYVRVWPESNDLGETELSLALPGTSIKSSDGRQKSGNKRRLIETIDLKLEEGHVNNHISCNTYGCLVGWPPMKRARRKYVKVAVDGAAYLRKVDLEMYNCYGQLFTALENMFQGVITICKTTELERKEEFLATYEDKDGDWMLVVDGICRIVQTYAVDENCGCYWVSSKVKRACVSTFKNINASDLLKYVRL